MFKFGYMLEHPKTLDTIKVTDSEMSESEMGNQQERSVALARLAMLVDCEGCVVIRVMYRGTAAKHRGRNLVPMVEAVNTSKNLMDWTADVLAVNGVPFYRLSFDPTARNPKTRQIQHRVSVQGMKRVKKILPLIIPYLIVKKRQAELILEFITRRESKPRNLTYDDRELEIANEVRSYNCNKGGAFRPISSETARQTHEMRDHLVVKIQSELPRDGQKQAEMTCSPTL